ncbi:hypothetical protein H9P43_002938 [Blastocladiella emersonii ATCC 22665]|nr:hypothetical protein H9P43_002938 [Blastocladiella emersonii ATCC 22665]
MACPFVRRGSGVGFPTSSSSVATDGAPGGGAFGLGAFDFAQAPSVVSDSEPAYRNAEEQGDPVTTWRDSMDTILRRIFENLRLDIDRMETHIRQAENEVFRKEEEAFFIRQDEIEVNQLLKRQADELQRAEDVYQAMLEERKMRKHTKKLQATIHKEAKARDTKMCYQDEAKHMAMQLRNTLAQHRKRFEFLIIHIDSKHDRQRVQLEESQERKIREQRALLEIETRGLNEDVRAEVFKDFAYRMNHQSALDKHVAEQLHDLQQLELKHRKERFDAEAKSLEEVAFLRATQHRFINELEAKLRIDYSVEKERIDEAREKIKLMQLEIKHMAAIKALQSHHKVQTAQSLRSQRTASALRLKKWRELNVEQGDETTDYSVTSMAGIGSMSSLSNSDADSAALEGQATTDGSTDNFPNNSSFSNHPDDNNRYAGGDDDGGVSSDPRDVAARTLMEDQARAQEQLNRLIEQLKAMVAQHAEELKRVRRESTEEMRKLERAIKLRMDELDLQQDTEMRSMRKSHESANDELLATQQREYQMDASIRVTERKMLTERRTLNSVLNTVADGIINILPDGTLIRFNLAAERMFGHAAADVIGQNIKMLQPHHIAVQHDGFLRNYMRTGVKRAIGSATYINAKKKDGSEFPTCIFVSEVKEEEFHLFTGIVRDLTEENAKKAAIKAKQEQKEAEMKALIDLLDVERTKSQSLIKEILPESIAAQLMRGESVVPTTYPDATVLYTDLVGFTAISSAARPLDVVDMLNDLYSSFDEIIEQYDVYKVETIGDSYMVASGVPRPNGNKHLSEMAKLAIHLVKAINSIKIRHRPDVTLRMRIGIHTGPVVAGVVGRKMPRYCLFGDTISIASKMESSGVPMKIQISETTYDRLEAMGGYHFEPRGEMGIPGKGMIKTYFLTSIDGFNPTYTPRDDSVASPLSALAVGKGGDVAAAVPLTIAVDAHGAEAARPNGVQG